MCVYGNTPYFPYVLRPKFVLSPPRACVCRHWMFADARGSLQEVERLVRLLIRFYSPHAHHHVEAFNLRPEEFDLDKMLKETPRN